MVPFRQLNYVVAVADYGSISAAAEKLAISQPAISAAIQKVEDEYQLKIFIRERPRRVVLSPVGRIFIAQARRLLESAQEFDDEARNTGQTLSGTVEVGCFEPTSAFVIPMILRGLREKGLDISIQVLEADLDELNNMLSQGRVDVALTYNMAPSPGIAFETLVEAPPYALIAKDHPLAKQESVSLAQLSDLNMVALNLPITQQFFLSLFSRANLSPRIKHQAKSYELVRSLVGAGEGYALLIMRPVNERTYDGSELAYLPLQDEIPPPRYGLAFTNRSVPTRLVEAFANVCRDALKSQGGTEKYYVQLPDRAIDT